MTLSMITRGDVYTNVLPKNLLLQPDVPLEGFENAADWTAGAGSTIANNSTEYKVGSQAIKLTTPSGGTGQMTKTVSWAGIDYEFFEFWFYNHGGDPSSIKFYVSSTTDFSKSFNWTIQIDGAGGNLYAWQVSQTWMLYRIPLAHMTNTGGESWSNTMIRVRFEVVSSSGAKSTTFDGLAGGYKRTPAIVLYHDDGYITLYSNGAFAHMQSHGLRGNVFLAGGIHKSGEGVMMLTKAQLQEMAAAGWNIASHGYQDGAAAYGMGDLSLAGQEYMVGAEQFYVNTKMGIPGYERHFSFNGSGTVMNNANSETAIINANALTARGGYGALNRPLYLPPGNLLAIPMVSVNGMSLQAAKDKVDDVIAHGQCSVMGWDQLDGANWTTANYNDLMDYIAAYVTAGSLKIITIDELYRLTLGPIGTPNAEREAAPTWTMPAFPVDSDFEENNWSEWDWKYDTGNNLTISAGAAMNGTSLGMNVHFSGNTTPRYLMKSIFLPTETDFCVRFYFDPNSSTIAGTNVIINLAEAKTGSRGVVVYITYSSGNYYLRLGGAPDNGSVGYGTAFVITDAPHRVEVVLHREVTDGAADGWAKIYIDGSLADTVGSLANFNLFQLLDRVSIGMIAPNAGCSGDVFIDEVKMNRTGDLIGA